MTPSLGADEAEKGGAFNAELVAVRHEPTPEEPKPAKQETDKTDEANSEDAPSSVIELAARLKKAEMAETAAVPRETAGRVTVRPKPEKRKNAKERAKEKSKGKPEATEIAAVTPEAASPEATSLATAHPKPEKRKNAKERAKEKYAKDRTTPDTTAKAKSKVETKAKSKKSKAAS